MDHTRHPNRRMRYSLRECEGATLAGVVILTRLISNKELVMEKCRTHTQSVRSVSLMHPVSAHHPNHRNRLFHIPAESKERVPARLLENVPPTSLFDSEIDTSERSPKNENHDETPACVAVN